MPCHDHELLLDVCKMAALTSVGYVACLLPQASAVTGSCPSQPDVHLQNMLSMRCLVVVIIDTIIKMKRFVCLSRTQMQSEYLSG